MRGSGQITGASLSRRVGGMTTLIELKAQSYYRTIAVKCKKLCMADTGRNRAADAADGLGRSREAATRLGTLYWEWAMQSA